jgi:TetR/AcrR family transcriptional repressor of nem operon
MVARTKEFEPDVALARAMDVFWERGYEASSMQELVDRMKIGRRSLYDTFGDKHALFLAALQQYTNDQEAAQIRTAENAAGPRQALRLLFERSLTEGAILRRGCLAVNSATELAAGDPEVAERTERHFAASRQLLQNLIEQGQREGSVAAQHSADQLAAVLFNAWLGFRVRVTGGASLDQVMSDLDDTLGMLS